MEFFLRLTNVFLQPKTIGYIDNFAYICIDLKFTISAHRQISRDF